MRKNTIMILACLIFTVILSGCGISKEEAKELSIAISDSPSTVDPQLVSDTNAGFVADCFTSRLYKYNENRELVPCLAKSCDVSEDGLTYTFHLREGLKWSDGRELKAEDFVFAFRRLADPDVGSNAVYLITDCCVIRNVEEVTEGIRPVNELGVYSPDHETFVVELEAPCPYFCALITSANFAPCNEDFYHSVGDNYANSAETMLCSGPYIMDRYEPLAMQIHFKKNPNYFDADKIKVPGINLQVVANQQQALMCYESDMMDITFITGELLELAEGDPELSVFPMASLFYLDINQKTCPELSNKNIRMAISKSIDRDNLCKNLLKAGNTPMTRVIPSDFYIQRDGTDFAKDSGYYDKYALYDPVEAKKLWDQGLSELGVSGMTLNIVYASGNNSLIEAVKDELENTLPGLDVELKTVTGKEMVQRHMSGEYDLIFLGWVADYADPTAFLNQFVSDATDGGYNSPEFDELYEKIQSVDLADDPKTRDEMMHKAEDMIMEDAGLIPIFTRGNTYLIHDNVKGFQQPPTGIGLVVTGLSKEVR